jgi:hypothetical protein
MHDLVGMNRRQLQAEAKKHGVKANLASEEIVRQLLAMPKAQELKDCDVSDSKAEHAGVEAERGNDLPQEALNASGPTAEVANKERPLQECIEEDTAASECQELRRSSAAAEIVERLSALTKRMDCARRSLLSSRPDPENDEYNQPESQSSSISVENEYTNSHKDKTQRDSLEQELELEFGGMSPPKTTVLLAATPKCKTRPSLGVTSRSSSGLILKAPSPQASEALASPTTPSDGKLGSGLIGSNDGTTKQVCIYGAPQVSSTVRHPWTPSSKPHTTTPGEQAASATNNGEVQDEKEGEPASASGKSIFQSAEYWRLRAERSERKRRRQEEASSMDSALEGSESTQNFCKRITTLCLQVSHSVTPHKYHNAGHGFSSSVSSPPAIHDSEQPESVSQNGPDTRPLTPGAAQQPTTPSGASKSAKVSVSGVLGCQCAHSVVCFLSGRPVMVEHATLCCTLYAISLASCFA